MRKAFMLLDAIIGLSLLGVLMSAMMVALVQYRKATDSLADSRQAIYAAEAALTEVQAGQPLPVASEGERLTLRPIDRADAPVGYRWVEVEAGIDSRSASLIGLVPAVREHTP